MDTILHRLESHLLRGPSECARVLGVGYSGYCHMKTGRPIPDYVRKHAETLLAMDAAALNEIVRERLRGR
jgi:hypothetical protein